MKFGFFDHLLLFDLSSHAQMVRYATDIKFGASKTREYSGSRIFEGTDLLYFYSPYGYALKR